MKRDNKFLMIISINVLLFFAFYLILIGYFGEDLALGLKAFFGVR